MKCIPQFPKERVICQAPPSFVRHTTKVLAGMLLATSVASVAAACGSATTNGAHSYSSAEINAYAQPLEADDAARAGSTLHDVVTLGPSYQGVVQATKQEYVSYLNDLNGHANLKVDVPLVMHAAKEWNGTDLEILQTVAVDFRVGSAVGKHVESPDVMFQKVDETGQPPAVG